MKLRQPLRCLRLEWAAIAATLLLPAAAQADYQYVYTGNPFSVTWTALFDPDLPPALIDTTLSAVILSPTKLVAGAGLPGGASFSLTQNAPFYVTETLVYPYPYPPLVDGCGLGTPCYPFDDAIFNIDAVDASGVPTAWDVGIDFSYRAPTGREYSRSFLTSTGIDSIAGGYEGFSLLAGSLTDHPGTWTVTTIAEPGSAVLLLTALGLMGWLRVRRAA